MRLSGTNICSKRGGPWPKLYIYVIYVNCTVILFHIYLQNKGFLRFEISHKNEEVGKYMYLGIIVNFFDEKLGLEMSDVAIS